MTPPAELTAALDRAAEALRDRRAAVADLDCDPEAVVDAYETLTRLMDDYEARATDWDDFEGYVAFRDDFAAAVGGLPPGFAFADAVEAADEALKTGAQSVLSTEDFEAARDHLAPLRSVADAREALRTARERYREARGRVTEARQAADDRIAELERLVRLSEADLSASVERLRDPVETHDEAVRDAVEELLRSTPAREALTVVATAAEAYPLVPFDAPSPALVEYLRSDAAAGDCSVSTLLSYCDHSRSKLSHHVDDADRFRAAVATNRTYLRRLDAEPLVVGWPPPPPGRLRFRARELVAVEGRFAPESTVAAARRLQRLAGDPAYGRLRDAAVARAELTEAERERVADGEVAADLDDARARRETLSAALDEHPPLSAWPAPESAVEPSA
ncbi:MAG: hypothetical protein ABEJ79_06165 [Halolamina sp.]